MTHRLRLSAKDKNAADSTVEIEVEADTPEGVEWLINQTLELKKAVSF
jgi:hypothetical protein